MGAPDRRPPRGAGHSRHRPHPEDPETVYVGTQHGPYRSTDHGEHWERLDVPDHGLPVWSLLFDPRDSNVLYAGYENCEIYRSEDGGEHWQQLPVTVRFPEVTVAPGANPAKRVLKLAANPANSNELYGAIEVGGIIRSLDGGEHWENMSHGQYLNDDTVDMHGVLVGRWRPGMVLAIARAGLFRSTDRGEHWASARLEPLESEGTDLLPRHPRGAGRSEDHLGGRGRELPERRRRPVPQHGRRLELGSGGHGRQAQDHHVRPRLRPAAAQAHVLRDERRRGVRQRGWRPELGRASACPKEPRRSTRWGVRDRSALRGSSIPRHVDDDVGRAGPRLDDEVRGADVAAAGVTHGRQHPVRDRSGRPRSSACSPPGATSRTGRPMR